MNPAPPLAVDLDGTLVNTDLFFESAVWYILRNPLRFFQMCWWFVSKGRAELKIQIEKRVSLPVSHLPFNQNVLKWLRSEKEKGRELVLVTGASQKYAEQTAEHLGLFSQVFGVCRERPRLTGRNKSSFLVQRYGEKNFDYIGNSLIDLAVWEKARKCTAVNSADIVIKTVRKRFPQIQIISEPFSAGNELNLFKNFISALALRICVIIASVFSVFFLDKFPDEWSDIAVSSFFAVPSVVLFYTAAFFLGEMWNLGPHRVFERTGIFVSVHPYWGLLSIPLFTAAVFHIWMMYDLPFFSVGWFFLYFVLECMRWIFRKYSFYFDMAVAAVLWTLSSTAFACLV